MSITASDELWLNGKQGMQQNFGGKTSWKHQRRKSILTL
jgi:hypothetical protein